jgi:cytidylate kinase
MGHVVLVGRGANVVTSRLDNVLHVRLVGSVEKRTERVQHVYELDRATALEFLQREDKGRRRYLKEHFHKDIDNPLLYHLIIHTDRISYEHAAELIGNEVMHRFYLDRSLVGVDYESSPKGQGLWNKA